MHLRRGATCGRRLRRMCEKLRRSDKPRHNMQKLITKPYRTPIKRSYIACGHTTMPSRSAQPSETTAEMAPLNYLGHLGKLQGKTVSPPGKAHPSRADTQVLDKKAHKPNQSPATHPRPPPAYKEKWKKKTIYPPKLPTNCETTRHSDTTTKDPE